MSWLSVGYIPGFATDLTSWTTTIERKGKLRQQVDAWPSRTTVTLRATLREEELAELAQLVAAIDFAALADLPRRGAVMDDTSEVSVDVKEPGQTRGFRAPLLWWAWCQSRGNRQHLPDFDFVPALRLWRAVDRLAPHHLDGPGA